LCCVRVRVMLADLEGDLHEHVAKGGADGKKAADADEFRLAHSFYDAYKESRKLLKSEDAPPPEQAQLDELASKLKVIAVRVGQLRLFSPNEELDDISTADLKFLLTPYLLAEVLGVTRDMSERVQALRQALIFWRAFAADCQRLGVAHAEDSKALDRNPEHALDPKSKRDEKIDRYKRTKELDEKVAYLFKKKREVLGDEFQWGFGSTFDEEMERDLILALLGRAVATAAEDVASAEQELPLLEMMAARGGPGAAPPERPPPSSEKPFIVRIQDKAELMKLYKEMVFQCPYELPTMTLAEAAEIEMEQMREKQERQASQQWHTQVEEDDRWLHGDRQGAREEEEEDRKVYKDRDWDDWKDANPWGSGNKMNNIS
jgi:immunoglobulin-binding protein 1